MPNFLSNYMLYCEGCETPELYDLWSGLVAMSSIVSRRVWVNLGYFSIYPNLYVVLVGSPGGRKTSAMNVTKNMLAELGDIPFAASCMTKESLCRYMSTQCVKSFQTMVETIDSTTGQPGLTPKQQEYTPITLCLTELSHFLGANSAHMIDFLTTIYDQEVYDAKTKNKGDDIIPGPYLTILACTTPSNITRYLKEDVISGGFSRRALFAFELDDGDPIAFPVVTQQAQTAWNDCIQWGRSLADISGEFEWHPDARAWYEPWYNDTFIALKQHRNMLTRGYYKSKHIQLLKIAMLFALSESRELVLKVEHLQAALATLEKLEINMEKVYAGMGRNELNAVASRIVEMLEMAGVPIPQKEIEAQFFRDADSRELYNTLTHLKNIGSVVVYDIKDQAGNVVRKIISTPTIMADWLKKQTGGAATSSPPVPDS